MLDAIETGRERDPSTRELQVLDRILGSRSHVRLLRTFVLHTGENLGVRDAARAAGISHSRTARVLTELLRERVVEVIRTRRGPIHRLNREHFLVPGLVVLFDDEVHVLQRIEGHVQAEARRARLPIRTELMAGVDTEVEIVIRGWRPRHTGEDRWLMDIEDRVWNAFGIRVRVRPENPDEWLINL